MAKSSARRLSLVRVKPVVIRQTKVVKPKRKGHGRRRGHGGTLFSNDRMEMAGAGFGVGVLEKMDFIKNLPHLPMVGTTGTIAIGAHLMSDGGRNKMLDNICTAAAVVALYQLGSTGAIVGGDGMDGGWGGI